MNCKRNIKGVLLWKKVDSSTRIIRHDILNANNALGDIYDNYLKQNINSVWGFPNLCLARMSIEYGLIEIQLFCKQKS